MKKVIALCLSFVLLFSIVPISSAEENIDYVIEPRFDYASPFREGIAAVSIDGETIYIDKAGKQIGKSYYGGSEFNEGLAVVYDEDSNHGVIDKTGREIVKLQKMSIGSFQDGMALIIRNGKIGFINNQGKEVIKPIYDEVENFQEGIAVMGKNGKYGYVNKAGKEIVKPQFDYAASFSDGLGRVEKNGKSGFVDKTGKVVIPIKYHVVTDFVEGLSIFRSENHKAGVINKSGKIIVPLKYDGIEQFNEGFAVFQKGSKFGYINKAGKEVIGAKYDHAYYYMNNQALVKNGEKYFVLDKNGKVKNSFDLTKYDRILTDFEFFFDLESGIDQAVVIKNGKYGYVDRNGKEIVKPKYSFISTEGFKNGFSTVELNGKSGYIDTNGREIGKIQFDEVNDEFSEGLGAVRDPETQLWGYIGNPYDTPSEWAKSEVNIAISQQLVPKVLQFEYKKNITRQDYSRLVMNLLEVKLGQSMEEILAENGKSVNQSTFMDTKDTIILAANALGIVSGKGQGKFDPNGSITRQEAATMLARTAQLLGVDAGAESSNFADINQIASWAKESVAFVSSTKDKTNQAAIMGGTDKNKFSPNQTYTREQAIITMKRLYSSF